MQNRAKNTLIEYNGSLMIILYDFLQESSVMPRSKNDSNLKKKSALQSKFKEQQWNHGSKEHKSKFKFTQRKAKKKGPGMTHLPGNIYTLFTPVNGLKNNAQLTDTSKIMVNLHIDNMSSSDYIPSAIDRTDLVIVQPVHLLRKTGGRGLFAREDIPKGTCIGIYTGEVYSEQEFEQYLMEHVGSDKSYAMYVGGRVVDAARKGNLTRYINFSDSQDNAEFVETTLNRKKVVKVITTKNIKAGQQLLINYNTYEEQASRYYYFLNPGDGWLSAQEFYQTYQSQYRLEQMPYNLEGFDLKAGDRILMTQIGRIIFANYSLAKEQELNASDIDLPFLKVGSDEKILDFDEADTFTPLMAACYLGQVENVKWLIEHGANIDQQQSHSGHCPLSLTLKGYSLAKDTKKYIDIIQLLIKNQVNLLVHDRSDKTFLHNAALVLNNLDFQSVVKFLIGQNPIDINEYFTYIDENDFDIVMHCYNNKLFDKALVLLAFYPDYFKRNYMSDNEGHNQFNINAFRKAIKDFNSNERNLLLMQLSESSLHLPEDLLEQLGIMDSNITLESKFF